MAILSTDNPGAFIFGLLGNISSFVVFLAPLPTFIRICKKRSTEGFQSVPYVVSLFSSMLWMYYAFVKTGAFLLITINAFGCVVETVYIAIYVAFAPKQSRISTLRLLLLMDFGGFCSILLVSQFLTKGSIRVEVLGWICVAFATSVFAAPLSIIRQVIRTKSVEFMPFYLSFFLTVSAITWLCYGVFLKDLYIAIPNVLGFVFGFLQMVLYGIYRNKKTMVMEEVKLPEHSIDVAKLSTAPMESLPEGQDHRTSSYQNQITQSGRHGENNIVGVSCKLENHDHQNEYDQITDDQMEKIILGSNSSANPSQQLVVTCAA